MSKKDIKEIIGVIICGILNTIIAVYITTTLGVYNTIIFKTFSVLYGDVTWEVVIFMGLSLIEACIYQLNSCKCISDRVYTK